MPPVVEGQLGSDAPPCLRHRVDEVGARIGIHRQYQGLPGQAQLQADDWPRRLCLSRKQPCAPAPPHRQFFLSFCDLSGRFRGAC